ncbi:MAG: cobyric acid synthase [Nocardioides sp.]|nr:cobyric acid synthase [Nocardioides sp.]
MHLPSALLIAGTTSDAGKSIVTTGLCRAFRRRGIAVAPYKAQNMSNNSMVCIDSQGNTAEIGRAQWIQALAAKATPEPAMNPVLLKPGDDRRSHVVVMGQPGGEISSTDFVGGRRHLARAAHDAFDDLAGRYDVVVAEGAGSPAEINLREGDYVNMGLARHADVPTVVVGDIDRGGLFAAMYGTLALLEPADQRLIAGFVINKFRGDPSLLAPGTDELVRLTGRPMHGILPWHPDLWLDSEDALDLEGRRTTDAGARVAVIRLPRISNFTDLDALGLEPDLDVRFCSDARDLADADLVVLPGTRATLSDLDWLRRRGLDRAIVGHARAGRAVLGICGGAQMLGRTITDPEGTEGEVGAAAEGLGLVDATTEFSAEKALRIPHGEAFGQPVSGYEIHHGRFTVGDADQFPGGGRSGKVCATMWHGSLESDGFRQALLAELIPGRAPTDVSFTERREARLDLLGDLMEQHLDVDALVDLAQNGVPGDLLVLTPGDSR